MKGAARYTAVAALLGAGWFVVLLVPSWTRIWLLHRGTIMLNVGLMVATSVIVAWVFRGTIGRATERREQWVRAALLPYAGCAIYLTLWNLMNAVIDIARFRSFNVHDALVLYPWGLWSSMVACFVVVPYGFLCQHVMQRALEGRPDPVDERRAA
jgi:hypothetical protein